MNAGWSCGLLSTTHWRSPSLRASAEIHLHMAQLSVGLRRPAELAAFLARTPRPDARLCDECGREENMFIAVGATTQDGRRRLERS